MAAMANLEAGEASILRPEFMARSISPPEQGLKTYLGAFPPNGI